MTPEEYQERCSRTAIYREDFPNSIVKDETLNLWHGLAYCTMKLAGEAGEVVQGVAKAARDDQFIITTERNAEIFGEIGDCLWYVAMICNELGFRMSDVMDFNLAKLESRKTRGMLRGSGSER